MWLSSNTPAPLFGTFLVKAYPRVWRADWEPWSNSTGAI
jgi:hypothetical protein